MEESESKLQVNMNKINKKYKVPLRVKIGGLAN